MFTSTRLLYIASAAVCGIAAGGYVAWAIVSRYGFVAGLNDRAQLDTDILVVLSAAGALLAFPLGAAVGLFGAWVGNRVVDNVRRSRRTADDSGNISWVTRRSSDDG